MVIKDIEREDLTLYIEEQKVDNVTYHISKAVSPMLGIDGPEIRVFISNVSEKRNPKKYQIIHGINFDGNKPKSFYLCTKKNNSTTESGYTKNISAYYEEILLEFDKLINSEFCDFSDKALTLLEELKEKVR